MIKSKEGLPRKKTLFGFVLFLIVLIALNLTFNIDSGLDYYNNIMDGTTVKIEELDSIKSSLENIQLFIEYQKDEVIAKAKSIEYLKTERHKLKSLTEADRKLVDDLFLEQERRQKYNIWYERILGFLFGIIASIVGSFSFSFLYNKINNRP